MLILVLVVRLESTALDLGIGLPLLAGNDAQRKSDRNMKPGYLSIPHYCFVIVTVTMKYTIHVTILSSMLRISNGSDQWERMKWRKRTDTAVSSRASTTTFKMPRKRLRPTSDSSSDSDDTPETFTLAESKKSAKRKSEEIEKAHAAINRQSKLKNQEKDRVLKEQAKRRKERENAQGDEDGRADALEARMERAMKEAQDEESLVVDSEEERDGFSDDEIEGELSSDMEFGEDGTDEEEEDLEQKSTKHLPDHLFEAAFASQNVQLEDASNSTTKTSSKPKPSKKKKRKTQSKDIVLGWVSFRILWPC